MTYSIEGGNAAGLFEIDAASGELFYTGGGEDYETGSTSFELTVRASDGDQTTDTTATVSVTDVDEPVEVDPPVAEPDQSTPQTVSEPAGEDFSAGASTSGRVAVGDTATGNVGSNGDRDWFAVELVAGRTYVIDLRGSPTDDGTLSDPYLGGIHDSDGNLIARTTNDDGGQGYNSRVTFTATESGTHYIAAGAAGIFSGRGTYEVEVTDTSPPIVAPDPDSEDPPDTQEQVQQQEQDEPPAETVVPPAEPETAQAQDEAASVSEGDTDLPPTSPPPAGWWSAARPRATSGATATATGSRSTLEAGKTYRFDLEGSATGGGTLVTRICARSTTARGATRRAATTTTAAWARTAGRISRRMRAPPTTWWSAVMAGSAHTRWRSPRFRTTTRPTAPRPGGLWSAARPRAMSNTITTPTGSRSIWRRARRTGSTWRGRRPAAGRSATPP